MRKIFAPALPFVTLLLTLVACGSDPADTSAGPSASASASSARPNPAAPHAAIRAPERAGGALMRSADGARLYLADEDHRVLRVLPLVDDAATPAEAGSASASAGPSAGPPPPSASAKAKTAAAPPPPGTIPPVPAPPSANQHEIALPGAPAQVLPLDGRVLVTIRDPGLLLIMKEEAGETLTEEARIPLAADAWGLAITPDEKIAVVTSAWTHTVSGVDLAAKTVLWTADVAREPRGVVVHPNGKTAYVSHLTSGDLTRLDGVDAAGAKATAVRFPAAPTRTPLDTPVEGSLGYALVMDDAGHRLLAARHALGGLADGSWFGTATIDVLATENDAPLLAPRVPDRRVKETPAFATVRAAQISNHGSEPEAYQLRQFTSPEQPLYSVVQPRAMIVGHTTQSVFVASEGDDSVGEYPLMSAAPFERPLRFISVGGQYRDPKIVTSEPQYGDGIAGWCGAPTGLALSADEKRLYVFCRSTYDVATIRLMADTNARSFERGKPSPGVTIERVASDPGDDDVSRGRRLFYGARDRFSSGGMGCAGCHPDGRDDGHVWHEVITDEAKDVGNFLATKNLAFKTKEGKLGYPRQTPMLAGRVNAAGPYGWHAQNDSLTTRLNEGFNRHRWNGGSEDAKKWTVGVRANALQAFVRRGLVPPPRPTRELTEQEKTGKQLFESAATECTTCHVPASELTNRGIAELRASPLPGFEDEANQKFKTPSLFFVGGTPPYFHDGRYATLSAVISENADRMGKTSHLSAADQAALVAYLETL